ncbi:MAG: hypothetical protein QGI09_04250, partial [Dehalococcoidia bacterium]|nr:hypothetical protein [Dehalococcoidia bacterium]
IISGSYGAFSYALAGRVDILAALVMFSGAAVGAWIGAAATMFVRGVRIRLYFALVVLAAALATALKQASGYWSHEILSMASNYLILGAAVGMGAVILISLLLGMRRERQRLLAAQVEPYSGSENPRE